LNNPPPAYTEQIQCRDATNGKLLAASALPGYVARRSTNARLRRNHLRHDLWWPHYGTAGPAQTHKFEFDIKCIYRRL